MSLSDIPLRTLADAPTTLAELTGGKPALIVNVASKCGLTPQYGGLVQLQRQYGPRGFTVIGMPCNQFMRPGAGLGRGDRAVLRHHVRRGLPAPGEGRGQRARPATRSTPS